MAESRTFLLEIPKILAVVLLICLVTGLLSRPLGLLNNMLLNGMWKVVRLILL